VSIQPITPAPVVYRNQAAQRVLAVLSAFEGSSAPRGVSELARSLGMSKNMVHRALTTLVEEGFVARDRTGQFYQLGYRVLTLGAADSEFDIASLCRPALLRLHALTQESVYLSIIVGGNRVTIDEVLPPGPRVLHSSRGAPVPLHSTKMSRVLLAYLGDEDIDAYLATAPLRPLQRFPDPQGETAAGVRADIRSIRQTENVLWRNPHMSSAAYAIFPLLDAGGRPHAIITVGGPRERFDLDKIEGLLPRMLAIVTPLRDHLRFFPAPAPSWSGA
jgi:DNA-binding IclR family transcriptional regulator